MGRPRGLVLETRLPVQCHGRPSPFLSASGTAAVGLVRRRDCCCSETTAIGMGRHTGGRHHLRYDGQPRGLLLPASATTAVGLVCPLGGRNKQIQK